MFSILLCVVVAARAAIFFTEDGDHRGVADSGKSFAVAFADVDADGDLDMFITNSGSQNRLYMNTDGKGTFTDTTAQAGLEDEGSSRGTAFADVNGDGILDLYVTDASAANHLYIGDGRGKFKEGEGGVLEITCVPKLGGAQKGYSIMPDFNDSTYRLTKIN